MGEREGGTGTWRKGGWENGGRDTIHELNKYKKLNT